MTVPLGRANSRIGLEQIARIWPLLAVTLLALVLRVWALGSAPPGLDADEVSMGINAYAIARTGRDEYGTVLPLAFRAYGEYKRPAYVYVTAPVVGVLGLSPFSVRLPGALVGTLSVPLVYFIARRLTRSAQVGLLAALFFAFSPWALQLGRGAREVSLFLFALLAMMAALLGALRATRQLDGQRRAGALLVAGALAGILALYSYPSGLLVAPLLALLPLGVYRQRTRRLPRGAVITGAALVLVALIPLGVQLLDGRALARASQTSLLGKGEIAEQAAQRLTRDLRNAPAALTPLIHLADSKWMILGRLMADAYLAHFSPGYLFTRGDPEWRHHASDTGQLLLWDAPALVLGLAVLARGWRRPGYRLLGGWLLLGPLPAALAENAPHAVRSYPMLPALCIVTALGAQWGWRWLTRARPIWPARLTQVIWPALFVLSALFYFKAYYRDYPLEHDTAWSSGWLEAFQFAKGEVQSGRAQRVVVPPEVREGYAYLLFATGYDPREYLANGGSRVDEDWPLYPEPGPMRFPPYEVRKVEWQTEPRVPGTLYVLGSWNRMPDGARALRVTKGASGKDALQVIAFQP